MFSFSFSYIVFEWRVGIKEISWELHYSTAEVNYTTNVAYCWFEVVHASRAEIDKYTDLKKYNNNLVLLCYSKLHNEEFHNLYSSSSIIRMIRSRRMSWAGHLARMGEKRNAYKIFVGKPKGKRTLGRS
jgi:hypothetical protein